jgi:hypothetical protein
VTRAARNPRVIARRSPGDSMIDAARRRAKELGLEVDKFGVPIVARRRVRPPSPERVAERIVAAALASATAGRTTPLWNRAQPRTAVLPVDPGAPRMPDPVDPDTTAKRGEVEQRGLPAGCLSCPRRLTLGGGARGLSWGYCEGCEGVARQCPACGEHKPQVNWGYGWREMSPGMQMAAWVCPPCRADADQPEQAKRFTLDLDLDDVKRHLLVGALSRAPGKAVDQLIVPLGRIAAAVKAGGPIDVDISDCDEYQRGSTASVLSNVRNEVGEVARSVAERLYVQWVEQTVPLRLTEPPVRPLSDIERSVLLHSERPL